MPSWSNRMAKEEREDVRKDLRKICRYSPPHIHRGGLWFLPKGKSDIMSNISLHSRFPVGLCGRRHVGECGIVLWGVITKYAIRNLGGGG